MNIWTFDFLYDLTEQYKSFTELILLYPYFIRVSWQQISQYIDWILLNVLTHLFWFTVLVNVNQMYFISIARIIFGYSSVHKVYSKFRIWLFDNNKLPPRFNFWHNNGIMNTIARLNTQVCVDNSFWESSGIIISLCKYYIAISDTLISSWIGFSFWSL